MKTQSISLALAIVLLCPLTSAQWVQTNGPYGGDVFALTVSGTKMFAGIYRGGVFCSTNNGTSWSAVSNGLPKDPFDTLHYATVSYLAASGPNLFGGTECAGVFFSSNSGMSWTLANTPFSNFFDMIEIGTTLFAAADSGLFLSTNNGTSWTLVSGLANKPWCFAANGTSLFVATGGGVFLSTNYGTSWTAVNNGLPKIPYDTLHYEAVSALAVSGPNLFAGTVGDSYAKNPYPGNVFLSTDNGASWTAVEPELLGSCSSWAFAVSGKNVFARGYPSGLFRLTDNGKSGIQVTAGLMNASVRVLAVSGSNVFTGTVSGGVFRSTDSGTSWTQASVGLPFTDANTLAFSGRNLFVGTGGPGLFFTTNNGISWTETGLTNTYVQSLLVYNGNLFAGTVNGLFLSTNDGASWTNTGATANDVGTLAVSGTILFAGGLNNGVLRSTNNGTTWTTANSGFPPYTGIVALAVRDSNLFAGTEAEGRPNGVFLSTNSGTSWTPVNDGLTNFAVGSLAVFGTCLLVGTSGSGVFRLTDDGTSWTQGGLTNASVCAFVASGTNLFAGTGNGVFLSKDGGTTWTQAGLTNASIRTLAVFDANLFAGTQGGGVWRRPLSELATSVHLPLADHPTRFNLDQNYPNPFNPSTTIKYELPRASHVTLAVYDMLGREVSALVNERREAGVHEVEFDGTKLASGVYFYRLQAEDFTLTKKMLVVK